MVAFDYEKPTNPEGLIVEAWAEGFMVGGLMIMTGVAIANMRKRVLLHRLIVLELILGMFHGTFIFTNAPVYNWYLSTTAIFLNISWSLHNVIAWMKNRPFLGKKASMFYIGTVILAQPYWVLEITANFLFFSGKSDLFAHTRPYEVLFRDPWWVFTVCSLFWNIKTRYEFGYIELIRVSPRFGVLLTAMLISVCFIVVDILAVTHVIQAAGLPDGINPFWKIAFVFKCLTDTIVLDDFKTALDKLKDYKAEKRGDPVLSVSTGDQFIDMEQARRKKDEFVFDSTAKPHAMDFASTDDSSDMNHADHISFADALRSFDSNQARPGANWDESSHTH